VSNPPRIPRVVDAKGPQLHPGHPIRNHRDVRSKAFVPIEAEGPPVQLPLPHPFLRDDHHHGFEERVVPFLLLQPPGKVVLEVEGDGERGRLMGWDRGRER
jgi:hypothetical protein